MIKALTSIAGRPVVVLGLSDENWHRLRTGGDEGLGQPIRFNLRELGLPPLTVVILGGRTEDSIKEVLGEWLS
jgi:hypothetical protein